MNDSELKVVVLDVADWLWGTIEGGFNEQQTVSQIIVDAVIGFIPVVGDVTATRDLIAVTLRLADDPKKREEVLEWVTLVLLLFALVPLVGGVIKGVGKLVIKAGADAGENAKLLRDAIELLNRLGEGDAVKFIKELNLPQYEAEILGHWRKLMQHLDDVIDAVLRHMGAMLSAGMKRRLVDLRRGIRQLLVLGDKMIPNAIKEIWKRLQQVQSQMYDGEWAKIPASLKSNTREAEARLVERIDENGTKQVWEATNLPYPPNDPEVFRSVDGWPDLKKKPYIIPTFHGPIRAVWLPPGTTIRRVIEETSNKSGSYWTYALAKDGKTWREECAVLDDWSANGYYVELVVPEPGLKAWEGRISSQVANDAEKSGFGQVLPGGETQLYIDFTFVEHVPIATQVNELPLIPTDWTGHMGLHIPEKAVTLQRLGEYEMETKLPYAATTARSLRFFRGHEGSSRGESAGATP